MSHSSNTPRKPAWRGQVRMVDGPSVSWRRHFRERPPCRSSFAKTVLNSVLNMSSTLSPEFAEVS